RDLALELLDEARAGALGRRFGNAEADGVLRRRLGDERDRDPLAVNGRERARRDAGDAQHPVPLHREQRLPRHRGERLHGIGVEGAAPRNPGTTGTAPRASSGPSTLRAARSVRARSGEAWPKVPSDFTTSSASTNCTAATPASASAAANSRALSRSPRATR